MTTSTSSPSVHTSSPAGQRLAPETGLPARTPAITPIVRRIDHLVIRVNDRHYDEFYALLSDTLRLPTPWPPTEHPAMRSGGIFAGNVDLEILYIPAEQKPRRDSQVDSRRGDQAKFYGAELYGVVFEAWEEDPTRQLAEHGFAYLPAAYRHKEAGSAAALLWMNYFLEPFWQRTGWQKLIFGLKKVIPDSLWVKSAKDSSRSAKAVGWFFNQLFRYGVVFVVKYNPTWRDIDAERRISKAQLEMRAGGILGLIRVKEVAVGTTQLTESSSLWRKLLRPAIEETGLCWQVGDGPALRVIAAERDGIHHMVWEVASLADAQAALASLGLLGSVMPDEITFDPSKCFGLDIRLVEAPGGFVGG